MIERGDVTADRGRDDGGIEGAPDDSGNNDPCEYGDERAESTSGGPGEGEGVPRSVAGGVASELSATDATVAERCMS